MALYSSPEGETVCAGNDGSRISRTILSARSWSEEAGGSSKLPDCRSLDVLLIHS